MSTAVVPFEETKFGRYVLGLAEDGKMDLSLVHVLVYRSPEERVEYLKALLFETVIPRLERGEYKDELLLLYHLNALDSAVRDRHCIVLGWDAIAFDRDWTSRCREIYQLVAPHVPCDGKVSNALLSVNVRWWFHTTDDQEAEEIFDFLIEAARREGIGADDVIQSMVRSELYDRVASRQRLEKALVSLGKEDRWVRAYRLTKAISARWQRLLESPQVIFLAKVSQQFRGQPSSAEQKATLDQIKKVVELGNVARRAIELVQDDMSTHELCWEIKELNCQDGFVVIATEFRSRDHHENIFLSVSFAPDVLDHLIPLLLKSADLDHKALRVSVTFDGYEEVRPVL